MVMENVVIKYLIGVWKRKEKKKNENEKWILMLCALKSFIEKRYIWNINANENGAHNIIWWVIWRLIKQFWSICILLKKYIYTYFMLSRYVTVELDSMRKKVNGNKKKIVEEMNNVMFIYLN